MILRLQFDAYFQVLMSHAISSVFHLGNLHKERDIFVRTYLGTYRENEDIMQKY